MAYLRRPSIILWGLVAVAFADDRYPPSTLLRELEEMYYAMGGPNWFNKSGWDTFDDVLLTPSYPCNSTSPWFGVNCSAGHVITITLESNNLQGTIPSTFGSWNLASNLQRLDLSGKKNFLYGSVPFDIVGPKLSELLLHSNAFNGSLPSLAGAALTKYFVELNKFSGQLPAMNEMSSSLKYINVGYNSLTGRIDEFCNLPYGNLVRLTLEFNQFYGGIPSCLFEVQPNLNWLIINNNLLTGSISKSVCLLGSNLTYFNVASNQIGGSLPACLGSNTSKVESWQFYTNFFTGPLPDSICSNGRILDRFEMYDNAFTGSIPLCYGSSFPVLRTLLLHDNNLNGHLPSSWSLGSLNSFTVSNNVLLSGVLPSSLFLSSNLRNIVVEGTKIGGVIPSSICECSSLTSIALSGNKFTGNVPACISDLLYLENLHLARNSFGSSVPASLGSIKSLRTLDISFNALTGSLPASLGNLSKRGIKYFDVSNNFLSCELPAELVAWKNQSSEHVDILSGSNLFSCASVQSSLFSLTIPLSSGLASVDPFASTIWCADLALRALELFTCSMVVVFSLTIFFWLLLNQRLYATLTISRLVLNEIKATF